MGWPSSFEDIQERIDDALVRLPPIPAIPDEKRGTISRESLLDTNDLLRGRNEELWRLFYAVKMNVDSKINHPLCKAECARIKQDYDRLVRLGMDYRRNENHTLDSTVKDKLVPSNSRAEAKRRYDDAEKVVAAAKQALKQAEKARAKAHNDYQALIQAERNSTKYVHATGRK